MSFSVFSAFVTENLKKVVKGGNRKFIASGKLTTELEELETLYTPAQLIIDMLREIDATYLQKNTELDLQFRRKIRYAIEKIGQRSLFNTEIPIESQLDLATSKKPSLNMGWLNEYSTVTMEKLRNIALKNSLE